MEYIITEMRSDDWSQVSNIYEKGILGGNATFQTEVPTWEDWDKGHMNTCRLVAKIRDTIIGWAALSPVSSRCVYRGVAEVSVYVDDIYQGCGVGFKLLSALVEESEKNGLWTLQAGIFPENKGSIAIHEKCNFRILGIREKLGKSNKGIWRDVAFLERRSKNVGID